MSNTVLTITEAADHPSTEIARKTLVYHVRNGHLKARRTGKVWLINASDLAALNRTRRLKQKLAELEAAERRAGKDE
jgi:excisionase family DNA binding protein